MRDTVVIEDSTILAMASDPKFTEAIPCLANQRAALTPANTGCGSCARRRNEAQKAALSNIKSCLASLSAEQQTTLKTLLDATKIKVVFASVTGQISYVTF
jgi:hypothetical protein